MLFNIGDAEISVGNSSKRPLSRLECSTRQEDGENGYLEHERSAMTRSIHVRLTRRAQLREQLTEMHIGTSRCCRRRHVKRRTAIVKTVAVWSALDSRRRSHQRPTIRAEFEMNCQGGPRVYFGDFYVVQPKGARKGDRDRDHGQPRLRSALVSTGGDSETTLDAMDQRPGSIS